METSPGVINYMKQRGEFIKSAAIAHFQSLVRHTHPVTPPAYVSSFYLKVDVVSREVVIGNSDPASFWVEMGAHPRGGPTLVLAYHPLGAGIDAAASRATINVPRPSILPTRRYRR